MLRDYQATDAEAIVRVALAAFAEFEPHFSDWPLFNANVAKMPGLAQTGEIIVAEDDGRIVGAVAYIGPKAKKPAFFDPAWPVIRMLVVDPAARGKGVGRQLTEECLRRAERDQAQVIALHTTPIMTVALPMYLRMGFVKTGEAPDILGVPYAVYVKTLA
ncbi:MULTISPECIES: GNAT family N-acetyltransferase [Bradyrhizobium]|uniref:GNAT family N-acetyltransferase n=1 Tax=Bradyrhizobium arachidis TaxID=858423 RepID=A0AAE7TIS1_9BRAD|nr:MULTISPECIES: GNAT family N-acetyltransferase [Bradyrhizobium]QOG17460.1 GNAT family N-acetyltransferase [Bradyrhizobium sp. SEMIA]QOZ70223.1 GNAT family N-acetyltransferase [Bradyrhizobium arachidis]UFW46650.1 GNAT family N-acetyltransferase [Bradyrhizobium arachidis]SFU66962.1 Ribosomal protein S18 acetylase RimI [Bradyrhizobium arachidis]